MSENIDLKELEKKAYRSIFQDGFWDLFMGMIYFGIAFNSFGYLIPLIGLLNNLIVVLIWNIVTFLVFYLGKKYVTIPRMGLVKFGPKRKADKKKLMIFLFIMFGINVILVIIPFTGILQFLDVKLDRFFLFTIVGVGFFWLPFSILAYFLKFNRLYIIAMLGGVSFIVSELIYPFVGAPLDIMIPFGISGGIITITGVIYLIRFLRNHPLPKGEGTNDG